jgi:non-lysosomal glucosylceramidase
LDLLRDGHLDNLDFNAERAMTRKDSKLTIAVCVNVLVKAQKSEQIDFSLVWHMPKIHFSGDESKLYTRYYTRYFSDEETDCALNIASYSLANRETWREEIRNWRRPIIENK